MFWSGRPAPPVRLMPSTLAHESLPAPAVPSAVCLGIDEHRGAPVWHDFRVSPHLLALGDNGTEDQPLWLVVRSIVAPHSRTGPWIMLGDPSRNLDDDVPEPYRAGYAINEESLQMLAEQAVASVSLQLPDQSITADRLRRLD
jgi:S-DNA-T family DNA segregation ATPase FtsK/SpoIIIE